MSFQQPAFLWWLLGLLPILLLSLRAYRLGIEDLRQLIPTEDERELERVFTAKSLISTAATIALFASLILALSDPVWGEEEVESDREQLDISIAFDVSRSMYASDVEPSRLEEARDATAALIDRFPESRVGFTAFRGMATQVLPVTADRVAFDYTINTAGPPMITAPGTDIAAGIRTALEALPEGSNRHGVILLVSDGEELSGEAVRAAREAAELSIPVFVFGVGDPEGSTIELPSGELVRDSDGEIVVTYLDEGTLRRIAEVSRGFYANLRDTDATAVMAEQLQAFERGEANFRIRARRQYGLFVVVALFSVLIQVGTRVVRWRDMF